MTRDHDHDFDFEPMPGLPAPLPEGERLIWRGRPDPWRLAWRACRVPWVAAYFAALATWQAVSGFRDGASLAEIGGTASFTATLAALSIALVAVLGWTIARNTFYTVTSRRVIVRHGIAMPMAINIPYARIDGAGLRAFADGTGDITLRLAAGARIPHLLLWPSARPFRMWPSEPMLRALPDGARVAVLVADALAAANAADLALAEARPSITVEPAAAARRPVPGRPDARRPRAPADPATIPADTVAVS